jgi:hypothetical protein
MTIPKRKEINHEDNSRQYKLNKTSVPFLKSVLKILLCLRREPNNKQSKDKTRPQRRKRTERKTHSDQ